MAERKQQLCRDTLNMFAKEDHNHHWSRSYWYYATFPNKDNNKIWTSGIAHVGCVPKVFDCKEVVTWCVDKFVHNRRMISL